MAQSALVDKVNLLSHRWQKQELTPFEAGKELFMLRISHTSKEDRSFIEEHTVLKQIWDSHIGVRMAEASPKRKSKLDEDVHLPHSNSPYAFPG